MNITDNRFFLLQWGFLVFVFLLVTNCVMVKEKERTIYEYARLMLVINAVWTLQVISVWSWREKSSISLTVLEMDQNHQESLSNQVQYYQSKAKINCYKTLHLSLFGLLCYLFFCFVLFLFGIVFSDALTWEQWSRHLYVALFLHTGHNC